MLPSTGYSLESYGANVQHQQAQEQTDVNASNTIETIDLDKIQKLDSRVVPADPSAPIYSNMNPLRLIQHGDQFITTQPVDENNLQEIVNILSRQGLISTNSDQDKIFTVYDQVSNKQINIRVTHRRKRLESEAPTSENGSASTSQQSTMKRRRGRRPGRKNKNPDDDDPDYEPELPEEVLLPFPIVRNNHSPDHHPHLLKQSALEDSDEYEEDDEDYEEEPIDLNINFPTRPAYKRPLLDTSTSFGCEECDRYFDTKAGLSRHRMLMHNPEGKKIRVGRRCDPALQALRRRNNLKEALEKATPLDIVDIAGPKVAECMGLWDFLFLRTEAAVAPPPPPPPSDSTPSWRPPKKLPLPPPNLPDLVLEYLRFVKQFREFFAKHSKPTAPEMRPRKRKSSVMNTEETGLVDVDNIKLDEEDERIRANAGPLAGSVKLQKILQARKRRKLAEEAAAAAASGASITDNGAEDATNVTEKSPENMSKCEEEEGELEEVVPEGAVQLKDELEASILGVEAGLYAPVIPFDKDYLPRRFDPALQLRREQPQTDQEQEHSEGDEEEQEEEGDQNQPEQEQQEEVEDLEEAVLAPDSPRSPSPVRPSKSTGEAPKRAKIVTADQSQPIQTICEALSEPTALAGVAAETSEAPQQSQEAENTTDQSTSGLAYTFLQEGLGKAVPQEWIDNGTFAACLTETGEMSELVLEVASGRIFHRPTGQLVSLNEGTEAVSTEALAHPAGEQVVVTSLSATESIVVTPSGEHYRVQHGPEGVTSEVLQTLLQLNAG